MSKFKQRGFLLSPYRLAVPPPTDIYWSSVKLLIRGGGADGTSVFIDESTGANAVSKLGSPTYSTANTKFASSSIYFNNASALSLATSAALDFGTGDFTIEWWAYTITSAAYNDRILQSYINYYANGFYVQWDTSAFYMRGNSEATIVPGGTMGTIGVWRHYAITRQGTATKSFKDGVLVGTGTNSSNLLFGAGLRIGCGDSAGSPTFYINAYLDSLRITVGVARYTATFTPPATAFPTA